MHKKSWGQNLTEYAVILAVVSAALIGMQVYIKRGAQGRLRDLAQQISPTQYERTNTDSNYTTTRTSSATESQNRATFKRTLNNEATTRSGSETTIGDD